MRVRALTSAALSIVLTIGLTAMTAAASPASPATATTPHWTAVSSGEEHSCALQDNGTLWCWGANDVGQLGTGDRELRKAPTQMGQVSWLSIGAGGFMSCAVRDDHTLWCWGAGPLGQGDPNGFSLLPTRVGEATDWATVSVGYLYACATRLDGTLWCWGTNHHGQLGRGVKDPTWHPRQIGSDTDWRSVQATIFGSTCALKTDATGWCWGFHYSKNGDARSQYTPHQLGDATWTSLSVFHGVQADGSLWYFGRGYQLVRLDHKAWSSVLERDATVCGIRSDDTLWCLGDGRHGNLGHGTKDQSRFVQITKASNWSAVTGGVSFGVGLHSDGTMWGWGLNDLGQVGDGTTTDRHHPVQIGG